MAALHGDLPEAFKEQWRSGTLLHPHPDVAPARAVRIRNVVHVADLREDRAYLSGDPLPVAGVEVAGIRTLADGGEGVRPWQHIILQYQMDNMKYKIYPQAYPLGMYRGDPQLLFAVAQCCCRSSGGGAGLGILDAVRPVVTDLRRAGAAMRLYRMTSETRRGTTARQECVLALYRSSS
jgi:hypothetical protein